MMCDGSADLTLGPGEEVTGIEGRLLNRERESQAEG